MNVDALAQDIGLAIVEYIEKGGKDAAEEHELFGAMLSGISLTAHFLAGNDGSKEITPQLILAAVQVLAKKAGFKEEKLTDPEQN